jgi:hypothetical protein
MADRQLAMQVAPALYLVYATVGEGERRHPVLTHQVRPRATCALALPALLTHRWRAQAVDGDEEEEEEEEEEVGLDEEEEGAAEVSKAEPASADPLAPAAAAVPVPVPEAEAPGPALEPQAATGDATGAAVMAVTVDVGALLLLPQAADAAATAARAERRAAVQAARARARDTFLHACEEQAASTADEVRVLGQAQAHMYAWLKKMERGEGRRTRLWSAPRRRQRPTLTGTPPRKPTT